MADNEAIPTTARAVVVNYEPDYCWTPLGGERVLVAYHIAAFFEDAALEAPTVLYNGMPAHNAGSRLTRCFGDEQGTGGGVKSGVYGGPCKPIGWSSTVNVEGKLAIRHSSDYWMNCDSLSGIGNCRGLAVYLREGQTLQLGADLFWHPNGNPNVDAAALLSLLPPSSDTSLLSPEQVQFLGHAIGLVGSVAEATLGGGACVFSPEPLTKVTGCVAFVHGIDSTVPHAYWFVYGGERETFTHQGVAGALEYAGVDPGTADTAAWWTDFGLSFVDVAPSAVRLVTGPGSALAGTADEAAELLVKTGDEALALGDEVAEALPPASALDEAAELAEDGIKVTQAGVGSVTQEMLARYGLTEDSLLYRTMDPQYLNTAEGTIAGNPNSVALVSDVYGPPVENPLWNAGVQAGYTPEMLQASNIRQFLPPNVNASQVGSGLNVAVGLPAGYAQEGYVMIAVRVGDVLDAGGHIYPDMSAVFDGVQPVYVTFDGAIPYTIVP